MDVLKIDKSVLVVNAGSSSLKMKFLPSGEAFLVERIGSGQASLKWNGEAQEPPQEIRSHEDAFGACLGLLGEKALAGLAAVGHRVVHGGETYTAPTKLDDEVIAKLRALSPLAPLHNPANLEGIRAAMRLLPQLPHVAVFDTAFHAGLPPKAYLYGLPRSLYEEQGLRRYGFHGTSHDYVTREAARLLAKPREALKLVSLHLGNGASAAAVKHGVSVDTSMGLTPLEGLLMGTRSGDLDPGLLTHLLRGGMSVAELDTLLNKKSGLLGLSGLSNDMRDLRAAAQGGNQEARQALDVFVYRIQKTVGAYAAAMGGLDALVFAGGIGENDAATREEVCAGLGFFGLELEQKANSKHERVISALKSRVAVLVVATDEEAMIAEAALGLV